MRALYAERQAALLDAVRTHLTGALELAPADAGMHLVGWLPPSSDDGVYAQLAAGAGVEATPLSAYAIATTSGAGQPGTLDGQRGGIAAGRRAGVVLGYTGFTPEELQDGVLRLARAWRRPPSRPEPVHAR
jgi:GntR family transcriptional regulator/MocR family aminotransferase